MKHIVVDNFPHTRHFNRLQRERYRQEEGNAHRGRKGDKFSSSALVEKFFFGGGRIQTNTANLKSGKIRSWWSRIIFLRSGSWNGNKKYYFNLFSRNLYNIQFNYSFHFTQSNTILTVYRLSLSSINFTDDLVVFQLNYSRFSFSSFAERNYHSWRRLVTLPGTCRLLSWLVTGRLCRSAFQQDLVLHHTGQWSVLAQSWALSVFLYFFTNKNDFLSS